MNVILLGAGRGERLMPLTASQPKCFTEVAGIRILDWTLRAFQDTGMDEFVFVGGYLIDVVRNAYPDFEFVENPAWPTTNILASLVCARDHMADGFYATYTDTLYLGDAVKRLQDSPHDITLVMDTRWRQRYVFRSMHPETDAEKMIVDGDRVVQVARTIEPDEASGEYTGVIKMTAEGASRFLEFHDDLHAKLGDEQIIADGRPFRMAYVIHLLDRMIRAGIPVHCVPVPGDYHEVDTIQDFHLATADWMRFTT
ncbi:MAG: phosphocholine cytidylyltransferase family protein [Chloroflexi bacterium]|nr:phosphocholine cytidylyltransferase family protein [Chloroflexota bacterium]